MVNQEEGDGRILAAGHDDGFVTLWHLEKRRDYGDMRNSHVPSPHGISVQWLPGQNGMVTSGADNTLKVGAFFYEQVYRKFKNPRLGCHPNTTAWQLTLPSDLLQAYALVEAAHRRKRRTE